MPAKSLVLIDYTVTLTPKKVYMAAMLYYDRKKVKFVDLTIIHVVGSRGANQKNH